MVFLIEKLIYSYKPCPWIGAVVKDAVQISVSPLCLTGLEDTLLHSALVMLSALLYYGNTSLKNANE